MTEQLNAPLTWARDFFNDNGIEIQGNHEVMRDMPWSTVYRFPTSQGDLYLKQMAPLFSIESTLLTYLFEHVSQQVPEVIARNDHLGCFIMKEAGSVLRPQLRDNYQIERLCEALVVYANIQKACISHVNTLLALGVQDWRLERLPSLYLRFLEHDSMLLEDGLNKIELDKLHKLYPQFCDLCDRLASYNIPETIEHGDFQDNNILTKNGNITINDWGDAAISHPFFSLTSCLSSASRNHNAFKADERYALAQQAYFEQWTQYGTQDKLQKAFKLADKIHYFQFAWSFSRIKACPGIEKFEQYKGYIANSLQGFIKSLQ